jgi:nicotinamide mononucleotide transporter
VIDGDVQVNSLELFANAVNAGSIVLAGRNSVHTWWTGIVGCVLFGALFLQSKLYADATLQVFFIATSLIGWVHWLKGDRGTALPVRRTEPATIAWMTGAGVMVTGSYGWLLHRFTDAYAPFVDSAVLAFSVVAQLLLMARRVESWWGWLLVNTISVPLFLSRGLVVTSVLYAGFWINALISLRHWNRLMRS